MNALEDLFSLQNESLENNLDLNCLKNILKNLFNKIFNFFILKKLRMCSIEKRI